MSLFKWFKSLFNKRDDTYLHGYDMESIPLSKVDDDQVEFKTYGECMSWIMKTGQPAAFEWDESKQCYIRHP